MECTILTSEAAVADIAGEWEQLQKRAGCSIFITYGWFDSWWRFLARPHGWKLHVVVGRENGRLVAIAPLSGHPAQGPRASCAGPVPGYLGLQRDFLLEDRRCAELRCGSASGAAGITILRAFRKCIPMRRAWRSCSRSPVRCAHRLPARFSSNGRRARHG